MKNSALKTAVCYELKPLRYYKVCFFSYNALNAKIKVSKNIFNESRWLELYLLMGTVRFLNIGQVKESELQ